MYLGRKNTEKMDGIDKIDFSDNSVTA